MPRQQGRYRFVVPGHFSSTRHVDKSTSMSRSAKFNMRWHIRIEMDEVENTRVAQEDTISDHEYRNICCDEKPS